MMTLYYHFMDLMTRGGYVMWPLLLLSLVSLTLAFERSWFWLWTNWPGRSEWIARVSRLLRQGDAAGARALGSAGLSICGHIVTGLLAESYADALATDAMQAVCGRIDRFMPTLST